MSQFNLAPITSRPRGENRNGTHGVHRLIEGVRTASTAVAGAVTSNVYKGIVTSEALTTAGLALYSLTLTNNKIAATSNVVCSVDKNGSAGEPTILNVTPAAGSVVINVKNEHASVALNAAIKIRFDVL